MAKVQIDRSAIAALSRSDTVHDALDKIGGAIASDARVAAPKRTGFAASTIHHEVGQDEHGPYVRVSWAPDAFYLMFHELGTSRQNATPFLRPALYKRRSV